MEKLISDQACVLLSQALARSKDVLTMPSHAHEWLLSRLGGEKGTGEVKIPSSLHLGIGDSFARSRKQQVSHHANIEADLVISVEDGARVVLPLQKRAPSPLCPRHVV
jgi:hypothetical protein